MAEVRLIHYRVVESKYRNHKSRQRVYNRMFIVKGLALGKRGSLRNFEVTTEKKKTSEERYLWRVRVYHTSNCNQSNVVKRSGILKL